MPLTRIKFDTGKKTFGLIIRKSEKGKNKQRLKMNIGN